MKALIVAPNRSFRSALAAGLEDIGIQTKIVDNAQQALSACKNDAFDALTFSHYLEDANYLELSQSVKQLHQYNSTPIYLICADNSEKLVNEAFQHGITEVFDKSEFDLILQSFRRIYSLLNANLNGRVLYAEDSHSIAFIVINILTNLGLKVDHFSDVDEASQAFKKHSYDLCITDLLLDHGHSGLTLIKTIRRDTDTIKQNTPILVTTGFNDPARLIDVFLVGANDYIAKPIVEKELLVRARHLINSFADLKQINAEKENFQKIALHDSLSGLLNRNAMTETCHQIFSNAKTKSNGLTMLLLHVQNLKQINDEYGQQQGDKAIELLGSIISHNIRGYDAASRWSNDQFLIVLSKHSDKETQDLAANMLDQIAKSDETIKPKCNVGFASSNNEVFIDFETLMSIAEISLN